MVDDMTTSNMIMIGYLEEIWDALEVLHELKVGGVGYSGIVHTVFVFVTKKPHNLTDTSVYVQSLHTQKIICKENYILILNFISILVYFL